MTLKNQWLKKPSIKTEELIALYQLGLSTEQIGKKFKLTKSSVGKRLKKAGVVLRNSASYSGADRYWLWKGENYLDSVARKRNQRRLRIWSKAVRDRDGNVCRNCKQPHWRLHAHHIVSIEMCIDSSLEFDIDNGITLCPKCHKRTHMDSKA